MKTEIALALFGFAALANAYGLSAPPRKLAPIPVPKNYGGNAAADPAPVVAVHRSPAPSYDEEPVVTLVEEPVAPKVVYKAPQRVLERQPIRVAYNKDQLDQEEVVAPVRVSSSGGRGGYGSGAGSRASALRDREEELELEQEYARSAQYHFASAVDDGIMDNSHIRQETRDGTKVTGTYAYSDGYFKRTVNYEADENGYRVVGEVVEPISESGPQIALVNGRAEVHTQIGGVQTQYMVSADELADQRRKHASLQSSGAAGASGSKDYDGYAHAPVRSGTSGHALHQQKEY